LIKIGHIELVFNFLQRYKFNIIEYQIVINTRDSKMLITNEFCNFQPKVINIEPISMLITNEFLKKNFYALTLTWGRATGSK